MRYVIVSHDIGRTVADGPEAAWGPFDTIEAAQEWSVLMGNTVSGIHHIVPLRTPLSTEGEQ